MARRYATTPAAVVTVAANKSILSVIGSAVNRPRIYYFEVSSVSAPGDTQQEYSLNRFSADGTGTTAGTPEPLDPTDAAAVATSKYNYTVEPTFTSINKWKSWGLHQRSNYQFYTRELGEFVLPAVAGAGVALRHIASSSGTPNVTGTIHWYE